MITDHKTDTVPVEALDRRTAYYRPQIAAYVAALAAATSTPVVRGVLLFLSLAGAVERVVDDLDNAVAQLRNQIHAS